MCGIAGIFGFDDSTRAVEAVARMSQCIAHRGPDDEGIFAERDVALAHRRLAIIDLSPSGHQPMFDADDDLVIVYNGEIYNFREIKPLLNGYPWISNSDTEVILAAYRKWGKNCLQYFNGMFAIAIWDKQKRELFIARDRLGIKPVYYYRNENKFLFASEVRSILASGMVPKKINRNALSDYFTYQAVHAPQTMVENIFMLMPGHHLTISKTKFEIEKYWSITKNISRESNGKSYREVCNDIYSLLSASVERRLISDVPFGAFLSGGIDSSAVVGLMSRVLSSPVKTFTIAFDEEEFSEAYYARIIAERFKTEHHEFILKSSDFLNMVPIALKAMDHPSGDGPNTYLVSKITRENGITMALSGLGGDELFAGYPVFKRTHKIETLKWIWNLPKGIRKTLGTAIKKVKPGMASEKIYQLLSSDASFPQSFSVGRQVNTREKISRLMTTGLMADDRVLEIVTHTLNHHSSGIPLLSRVSIAEISTYMQNVLLRDTDQMSMASALEVRVPFLDYKLVEYVLGVKDEFKYPVIPKKLLIDSIKELLPHETVHRKKMGFVFPWQEWLKTELKGYCDVRIRRLAQRPFMKEENLLQQWNNFLSGSANVRWLDMWLCTVLENWMEENEIEN